MVGYIHTDNTLAAGGIEMADLSRITSVQVKRDHYIMLTLENPDHNLVSMHFDRRIDSLHMIFSYAHEVTYL